MSVCAEKDGLVIIVQCKVRCFFNLMSLSLQYIEKPVIFIITIPLFSIMYTT